MPMRLGRLQRQSRRAFWASAVPEVSTSELAGWCWARQTLIEKRAPSRWQQESMTRAARSIGAVRKFVGVRPGGAAFDPGADFNPTGQDAPFSRKFIPSSHRAVPP